MGAVILEKMAERLGVGYVVDVKDVEITALHHHAENQPADSPETVDTDFDRHYSLLSLPLGVRRFAA
jgi:hypothetical protein